MTLIPFGSSAAHERERIAERVRRWSAPLIALLAATLALSCVVSLTLMFRHGLAHLALRGDEFVGWAAVGSLLSVGVAVAVVALIDTTGCGPALSLSPVAALLGLTLADDVRPGLPTGLTLGLLGVAVGGLLGGAWAMTFELPSRWARLVAAACCLPVVAIWPVLAKVSPRDPGGLALTVQPSAWLTGAVAVLLVAWSVLTMLLEPALRAPEESAAAFSTGVKRPVWNQTGGVLLMVAAPLLVVAVAGFTASPSPSPRAWLRPLILVTAAVTALGWTWAASRMTDSLVRLALLPAALIVATLPTLVQLAVEVSDAGSVHVQAWSVGLEVSAATAGAAVTVIASARGRVRSVLAPSLLIYAAATAGLWMLPTRPWLMTVALTPLLLAGAAVLTACAIIAVNGSHVGLPIGVAVLGALLLGLLLSLPVTWAVGGEVPISAVGELQAVGRGLLGLTFAAGVVLAAYTEVLASRLRRTPEIDSVLLGGPSQKGAQSSSVYAQ